jgi:hypothetical protein
MAVPQVEDTSGSATVEIGDCVHNGSPLASFVVDGLAQPSLYQTNRSNQLFIIDQPKRRCTCIRNTLQLARAILALRLWGKRRAIVVVPSNRVLRTYPSINSCGRGQFCTLGSQDCKSWPDIDVACVRLRGVTFVDRRRLDWHSRFRLERQHDTVLDRVCPGALLHFCVDR